MLHVSLLSFVFTLLIPSDKFDSGELRMECLSRFNEAADALIASGNKDATSFLEEGFVTIPDGLLSAGNGSDAFNWLHGRVHSVFTPLLATLCEEYFNEGQLSSSTVSSQSSRRLTIAAMLLSKWSMKSLSRVVASLMSACQSATRSGSGASTAELLKSVMDLLSELLGTIANAIRHFIQISAKIELQNVQGNHASLIVAAFRSIVALPKHAAAATLLRAYCATYVLRLDVVERFVSESRTSEKNNVGSIPATSFEGLLQTLNYSRAYAAAMDAATDGDDHCMKLNQILATLMCARDSQSDVFRCLSEDLAQLVITPDGRSRIDMDVVMPLIQQNVLDGNSPLVQALFSLQPQSCCSQALFAAVLAAGVLETSSLVSAASSAFPVPPALRSRIRISLGSTHFSPESISRKKVGLTASILSDGDAIDRVCRAVATCSPVYGSAISESQLQEIFQILSALRHAVISETLLFREGAHVNNVISTCFFDPSQDQSSGLCMLLRCASTALVSLNANQQQQQHGSCGSEINKALFDFYVHICTVLSSIIASLVANSSSSTIVFSNDEDTSLPTPGSPTSASPWGSSTGVSRKYSPWAMPFWRCVRSSPITHVATSIDSIASDLDTSTLSSVVDATSDFLVALLHVVAADGSCENPVPMYDDGDEDLYGDTFTPEDECLVKEIAAGVIAVSQTWAGFSLSMPTQHSHLAESLHGGALRIVTAMGEAAIPLLDGAAPSEDIVESYTTDLAKQRTTSLGSALQGAISSLLVLVERPIAQARQGGLGLLFGEDAASESTGLMSGLAAINLILQAATPSRLPEPDPDDDPEDFGYMVSDIVHDNERKASRLMLLADTIEAIGGTLKAIFALWVWWALDTGVDSAEVTSVLYGHLLGGTKMLVDDARIVKRETRRRGGGGGGFGRGPYTDAIPISSTDALLFGVEFDSVMHSAFSVFSRLAEATGTTVEDASGGATGCVAQLLRRAVANSQIVGPAPFDRLGMVQRECAALLYDCVTQAAALPNVAFVFSKCDMPQFPWNPLGKALWDDLYSFDFIEPARSATVLGMAVNQRSRLGARIVPLTTGGPHGDSIVSVEHAFRAYRAQLAQVQQILHNTLIPLSASSSGCHMQSAEALSCCLNAGVGVLEHRALSLLAAFLQRILDPGVHVDRDLLLSKVGNLNHDEVMQRMREKVTALADVIYEVAKTHTEMYLSVCLDNSGVDFQCGAGGIASVLVSKTSASLCRLFDTVSLVGNYPRQESNPQSFASLLPDIKRAVQRGVASSIAEFVQRAVLSRASPGGLFISMANRYHRALGSGVPVSVVFSSEAALLSAMGADRFPELVSSSRAFCWESVLPTLLVLGFGTAGLASQVCSKEQRVSARATLFSHLQNLMEHMGDALAIEVHLAHGCHSGSLPSSEVEMLRSVLGEVVMHLVNEGSAPVDASRAVHLRQLVVLFLKVDIALPDDVGALEDYWWTWAAEWMMGRSTSDTDSSCSAASALLLHAATSAIGGRLCNASLPQETSLSLLQRFAHGAHKQLSPSSPHHAKILQTLLVPGLLNGASNRCCSMSFVDLSRVVLGAIAISSASEMVEEQAVCIDGFGVSPGQKPLPAQDDFLPYHCQLACNPASVELWCQLLQTFSRLVISQEATGRSAAKKLAISGSLLDAMHAFMSDHLPIQHRPAFASLCTAPSDLFSSVATLAVAVSTLTKLYSCNVMALRHAYRVGSGAPDSTTALQQGVAILSCLPAALFACNSAASLLEELCTALAKNTSDTSLSSPFATIERLPLSWWAAQEYPLPSEAHVGDAGASVITLSDDSLAAISRKVRSYASNISSNMAEMVAFLGILQVVVSQGNLEQEEEIANAVVKVANAAQLSISTNEAFNSGIAAAIRDVFRSHQGVGLHPTATFNFESSIVELVQVLQRPS